MIPPGLIEVFTLVFSNLPAIVSLVKAGIIDVENLVASIQGHPQMTDAQKAVLIARLAPEVAQATQDIINAPHPTRP